MMAVWGATGCDMTDLLEVPASIGSAIRSAHTKELSDGADLLCW